MPTHGTNQQNKVRTLVHGKQVLLESSALLQQILVITKAGNDARDLKKLPSKLHLVVKGVNDALSCIDQSLKLDRQFRLANDLMTSSIALENQQRIVNERLHKTPVSNKRKSMCEQRLSALVSPSPLKKRKLLARDKHNKLNNIKNEFEIAIQKLKQHAPPEMEGSRCSLHQLVSLTQKDKNSPVHKLDFRALHQTLTEQKLCIVNLHTFRRHVCKCNNHGILPTKSHEGTKRGRPSLIPDAKISSLNDRVLQNIGKVDDEDDLSKDILEIVNQGKKDQGDVSFAQTKLPCRATVKKTPEQMFRAGWN